MKKVTRIFQLIALLALSCTPTLLQAQTEAAANGETLWTSGKINVVIIIAAIIFSGIALFLIVLERKLSKLENKITHKN